MPLDNRADGIGDDVGQQVRKDLREALGRAVGSGLGQRDGHGEEVACSHGDGGREKRGHEVERDDGAELLAHFLLGLGERADDEHEHKQRGDRLERADEQFAEDADAGSGHGGVGDQQGERRADGHADDDAQHEADAVVGFDEFHFFLLLFSFPVFASESL